MLDSKSMCLSIQSFGMEGLHIQVSTSPFVFGSWTPKYEDITIVRYVWHH